MGKKTRTSFKPGNKGGGRPKGSKNIKKVSKAEEVMVSLGFNPIEFLIELAQSPKVRPDIKAKIGIELSSLINPKPKDPTDGSDGGGEDSDDDLPEDEGKLLSIFKTKRTDDRA